MVMGPTHAMSGAAAWLAGVAIYTTTTQTPIDPSLLILGTAVAAGAALAPDIDSHNSTVVNSFGFVGKGLHHIANALSVMVYNLTKTRKDTEITGGHRTLFHTTVFAILAGGLVALATASTGSITIFNNTLSWGQLWSLVIMTVFLDLALGGLFEKQIRNTRRKYGPYVLLGFSLILAIITGIALPPADGAAYSWLGIAVGFGWFMHLLGDAITKMGVPMAWPLRIRGRAWWDVALPGFMRITAGGTVEKVLLLPALTLTTIGLSVYIILLWSGVVK
jgi:membrane-bound metal-dependent hydrolase YbcI (DUF457 family)